MYAINILGRPYQIRYVDLKEEFGVCHYDEGHIDISKALSSEDRKMTIVHEVIHAIIHESGHHHLLVDISENFEEALVRALDHGLNRSGLIRDILEDDNA